ncbi:hypothetical protein MXB_1071, partial [Myxobolus squamalis]
MSKRPQNANSILLALQSREGFLMGLYELLTLCQNLKASEFNDFQQFLYECATITSTQQVRAGNLQLDNFIYIIRSSLSQSFYPGSHAYNYVLTLIQALGYEPTTPTLQQPKNLAASPNISSSISQKNVAVSNFGISIANQGGIRIHPNLTNNQSPLLQNPAPTIISNNQYNPRMQEMYIVNNSNRASALRLPNEPLIMNNDPDANSYNAQMMQQSLQQGLQQSVMSNQVPMQYMNMNGVQRAPQMLSIGANQDDPNFGGFTPRFHQPMNFVNTRPGPNNLVFISNQGNRPSNAYISGNPQLISSNMSNAFIINNSGGMMTPTIQQMRGVRPMNQQNMMQLSGIRTPNPMNINNQMIRQPGGVFMLPQQSQHNQPQLIPQYIGTQGMTLDQQAEMMNLMQPMNNQPWAPNQCMQMQPVSSMPVSMMREQMGSLQNFGMPLINPGMAGAHFLQSPLVRPGSVVINSSQASLERSVSQPSTANNQSQDISRPISDSSKPSTMHYLPPPRGDTLQPLREIVQDVSISTREHNSRYRFDDTDMIDDKSLAPPIISYPLSPLKSATNDVNDSPTTIRLCNSIPACDSGPAMGIIEEAIRNIKDDYHIISSIPNSTFVEVVAKRRKEDYLFVSSQNFIMRNSIFDSVHSKTHIEIQIKCVDASNTLNYWPKKFVLRINEKSVPGIKTTSDDDIIGDECIFVKNQIQKNDNKLDIEFPIFGDDKLSDNITEEECPTAYKLLINLVLRSNISVMIRALVNKRTQGVRKSIEFIQNYFVSNPIEMARGYTIVSLFDPVSNDRILIPVRGENCKHVQCFDFESLCARHINRTHFSCPICGVIGALPSVIIDGFMCTLVSRLKECVDVSEVKITPECNWTVVKPLPEPCSINPSPNNPSPIQNLSTPTKPQSTTPSTYQLSDADLISIFGGDAPSSFINILSKTNIKSTSKPVQLVTPSPSKMISPSNLNIQKPINKRSYQQKEQQIPSSSKDPNIYLAEPYSTIPKKFNSPDNSNMGSLIEAKPLKRVGNTRSPDIKQKKNNSNQKAQSIQNVVSTARKSGTTLPINIIPQKPSITVVNSSKTSWDAIDEDFLK